MLGFVFIIVIFLFCDFLIPINPEAKYYEDGLKLKKFGRIIMKYSIIACLLIIILSRILN